MSDPAAPPLDASMTYRAAGVAPGEGLLGGLLSWVQRTASLRGGAGRLLVPNGYFASVVELTPELGLAICTDGVGTKVLVAEMLGRYDTIGIDCIAVNVNDLICVGAEPIAVVDYVATGRADAAILTEIGKGLYEGARQAGVTIPGGELAQLPEIIHGIRPGEGIDLLGTAVGTVHPQRILTGAGIRPGDVVIGLASSGVHSNGLTLARRVLLDRGGLKPDERVPELGRSIGAELLEPTRIYVRAVRALLASHLDVRAAAHITGDGFLNLARCAAPVGFVLDDLPTPPPVFDLIQRLGHVPPEEMYLAFNMGIGFCVVVQEEQVDDAVALLEREGAPAQRIGHAAADPEKRIRLPREGLVGADGAFRPAA